jgi:hypothetical protein
MGGIYEVNEMLSSAMIYISSFIKIGYSKVDPSSTFE